MLHGTHEKYNLGQKFLVGSWILLFESTTDSVKALVHGF